MEHSEIDKRRGLASELADIVHRQEQITAADEVIIRDFPEAISERLADLLEHDQKDLALLETVRTNFGIREEAKLSAVNLSERLLATVDDGSLTPSERLGAYALLRQQQVLCGHLVHKVGQNSSLDVKEALAPFLAVQSDFVKRAGEITTLVEDIGVRHLTGEEPIKGFAARLRDVGSAIAGAVAARVAKPVEEMNVLNVLRLDHMKVKTIFREMKNEASPQKLDGLYQQLRSDLLAHSLAEEQVVYAYFKQYPDLEERLNDAHSEHQELRSILDEMREYSSISHDFTARLRDLKMVVLEHVDEEEDEMFKLFREKVGEDSLVELSSAFANAKRSIQEDLARMDKEGAKDLSASA